MIVGPIFALLALVGLLAFFVWLVKLLVWLARGRRRRHPIDVLEQRFVSGEIDAAEFEQKRKLLRTDKPR